MLSEFVPSGFLQDKYQRKISYLRVSLTDRCNLSCSYCVTDADQTGLSTMLPRDELLSYEELLRVISVAVKLGINKVRLTGGEPLVRKGIVGFVRQLDAMDGLDDIRITTNGVLLHGYAEGLLAAGISRVNISLDSLQPKRFFRITGVDSFAEVWKSIDKALSLGFAEVKLNMVVMRGINDDELENFARLSLHKKLAVRFIEFMPIGHTGKKHDSLYVSCDEMKERLSSLGELLEVAGSLSDGPAKMYSLGDGAVGSIGFISPVSHHFCDSCNRLRLTSEGRLRSCLLSHNEVDIKRVVRSGGSDVDIAKTIIAAVEKKPRGHNLSGTHHLEQEIVKAMMGRIGG